jgi:hypothetical protein
MDFLVVGLQPGVMEKNFRQPCYAHTKPSVKVAARRRAGCSLTEQCPRGRDRPYQRSLIDAHSHAHPLSYFVYCYALSFTQGTLLGEGGPTIEGILGGAKERHMFSMNVILIHVSRHTLVCDGRPPACQLVFARHPGQTPPGRAISPRFPCLGTFQVLLRHPSIQSGRLDAPHRAATPRQRKSSL